MLLKSILVRLTAPKVNKSSMLVSSFSAAGCLADYASLRKSAELRLRVKALGQAMSLMACTQADILQSWNSSDLVGDQIHLF